MSTSSPTFSRIRGSDGDSLSLSVQRHICDSISAGELRPGEKLDAPEKLAESWGVSAGTLRHALQSLASRGIVVRRPRLGTYINPELPPNALLRNSIVSSVPTRKQVEKSDCLAMLVPDLRIYDFAAVVRGVEVAAESANLRLIVSNFEDNADRLNQLVRQHIDAGVAGLFIASGRESKLDFDLIASIEQQQIPIVLCYRTLGLVDWPVVRTDGYYNTYVLTRHLCDTGRKHIGYCDYGEIDSTEIFFKRDGEASFYAALADAGVQADNNLHLEFAWPEVPPATGFSMIKQDEVDRVAAWLKERPKLDALLCVCDRMAAIVVTALRQLGRRIPDDVAVTGFGRYGHLYGLGHGWLTSVDVKFADIGQSACDILLNVRNGKPVAPRTQVALKGTLCVGGSTVPA